MLKKPNKFVLLLFGKLRSTNKDEEKAKVFNAFFASDLNRRLVIFGVPCPKLEDRDREQKEALLIQEEMVREQLHPLATHDLLGQMISTQGYRRRWQECSLSHFPSLTNSTG